ncbi:nucleolar protein 3 isoform X2 [Choloepus didactylus]|uniref:nucleolar protein 3 isoform X2 n=1 Tax=Choloepus didactylus TaxID=27675 RepID=UPI00189F57D7|nr:nucleolar protein 3 isoform X2 [Choloepus didactylus]
MQCWESLREKGGGGPQLPFRGPEEEPEEETRKQQPEKQSDESRAVASRSSAAKRCGRGRGCPDDGQRAGAAVGDDRPRAETPGYRDRSYDPPCPGLWTPEAHDSGPAWPGLPRAADHDETGGPEGCETAQSEIPEDPECEPEAEASERAEPELEPQMDPEPEMEAEPETEVEPEPDPEPNYEDE